MTHDNVEWVGPLGRRELFCVDGLLLEAIEELVGEVLIVEHLALGF